MNNITFTVDNLGRTEPKSAVIGHIGEHNASSLVFRLSEELGNIEYFRVNFGGFSSKKLYAQNGEVACPIVEAMLSEGDGFLQLQGFRSENGEITVVFKSDIISFEVLESVAPSSEVPEGTTQEFENALAELDALIKRATELKSEIFSVVTSGSGANSVKIGNKSDNTASGENSLSGGSNSHAYQKDGIALGETCKSHNVYGISMGCFSEAYSPFGVAVGYKCYSGNENNIDNTNEYDITNSICAQALGWECNSKHSFSQVFGCHTQSSAGGQFVCGQYNKDKSNAYFILGNGSSETNRKNAFEVTDYTAYVNGKEMPFIEKGSWTPRIVNAGHFSIASYSASYLRMGRAININLSLSLLWDAGSDKNFNSNPIYISGLPYSVASSQLTKSSLIETYINTYTGTNKTLVNSKGCYFDKPNGGIKLISGNTTGSFCKDLSEYDIYSSYLSTTGKLNLTLSATYYLS